MVSFPTKNHYPAQSSSLIHWVGADILTWLYCDMVSAYLVERHARDQGARSWNFNQNSQRWLQVCNWGLVVKRGACGFAAGTVERCTRGCYWCSNVLRGRLETDSSWGVHHLDFCWIYHNRKKQYGNSFFDNYWTWHSLEREILLTRKLPGRYLPTKLQLVHTFDEGRTKVVWGSSIAAQGRRIWPKGGLSRCLAMESEPSEIFGPTHQFIFPQV